MTQDGVLDQRIDSAQAYEESSTKGGGLVAATGDKVVRVFVLVSFVRGHCKEMCITVDDDSPSSNEVFELYILLVSTRIDAGLSAVATPAQLKVRVG